MSYHGKYLKAKGQDCTINRLVPVASKVSIKRSTKSSTNPGARAAYWEGTILSVDNLQSGEVITIGGNKYLVQSTDYDPASEETAFFAAKSNAIIRHERLEDTVDDYGNLVQGWGVKNRNVPAFVQAVTAALRQFDPGLLEQTRYTLQASKSLDVLMRDRFVFENDNNYEVVSIDSVGMTGLLKLQLAVDTRP